MSKLDELRINSPVPKPRRRTQLPWVPIVLVLFIVALLVYFNLDKLKPMLESEPETLVANTNDTTAQAIPASRGPAGSITAAGYLEVIPPGPTIVSALVSGRVEQVAVIPGLLVEPGDLIARLDTGSLKQQAAILNSRVELAQRRLDRQRAGYRNEEVEQAEAGLTHANAQLELALSYLESSEALYAKGVISLRELEADQRNLRQAEAAVTDARSRLQMLESGTRTEDIRIAEAELSATRAELNQLAWEIKQCEILAPIGGVVLSQYAQPGDWVSPGRDSHLSGALVSIFDPSQVQAWVDVNQRDSSGLFVGQPVELTTDSDPQRVITGMVSQIMPQANLQKNTVQAKISIDNPPPDFRPELSVKVTFLPADSGSTKPEQEGV